MLLTWLTLQLDLGQLDPRHDTSRQAFQLRLELLLHLVQALALGLNPLIRLCLNRCYLSLHGLDLVGNQTVDLGSHQSLGAGDFLTNDRLEPLGDCLIKIAPNLELWRGHRATELRHHFQVGESRYNSPHQSFDVVERPACSVRTPMDALGRYRPAAEELSTTAFDTEVQIARSGPGCDAERDSRNIEGGQLYAP